MLNLLTEFFHRLLSEVRITCIFAEAQKPQNPSTGVLNKGNVGSSMGHSPRNRKHARATPEICRCCSFHIPTAKSQTSGCCKVEFGTNSVQQVMLKRSLRVEIWFDEATGQDRRANRHSHRVSFRLLNYSAPVSRRCRGQHVSNPALT